MKTFRHIFLGTLTLTGIVLFHYTIEPFNTSSYYKLLESPEDLWMRNRKASRNNMSHLGRHLFLNETLGMSNTDKTFRISVWKHGPLLEGRFVQHFKDGKKDPLHNCPVQNCYVTYDDNDFTGADAVFFHLQETFGPSTLPENRTSDQRWIFYTEESPFYTNYRRKKTDLSEYNGLFNWSMTYRSDSDIPASYGRTVPLATPLDKPILHNKPKLLAQMNSYCGGSNKRMDYTKNLSHYIKIDIYGHCGTLKCNDTSVHYYSDCSSINDYKFYLAFENSNCNEYITEKVWWNAFNKGAVPVVYGGPKEYYELLCPPKSFIHVDDFNTIQDLANYLLYLDSNTEEYNKYREWTKYFEVKNEHGYHGNYNLSFSRFPVREYGCGFCQSLN